MRLLALWGPFIDRNDRFPYPLKYFNFWLSSEIPTLSFSLEKVIIKVLHSVDSSLIGHQWRIQPTPPWHVHAWSSILIMENVIEFKYSRAPLYGHPPNTDTSLLQTVFLVPCPNMFSKFNPLNTDTPLIWTLSKVRINGIWLYPGVTLNQYNQTPLIRTLKGP